MELTDFRGMSQQELTEKSDETILLEVRFRCTKDRKSYTAISSFISVEDRAIFVFCTNCKLIHELT